MALLIDYDYTNIITKTDNTREVTNLGSGVNGLLRTGQALEFDGINQNIVADFLPSSAMETFSVFLEANGTPTQYSGIGSTDTLEASRCYVINIDNVNYRYGFGNAFINGTIPMSTPQHIVMTRDIDTLYVYVNGVLQGSTPCTFGAVSDNPLRIGSYYSHSTSQFYFSGRQSNVFALSSFVTQADVTYMYNNPEKVIGEALGVTNGNLSFSASDFLMCYPLMEGTGAIAVNDIINPNELETVSIVNYLDSMWTNADILSTGAQLALLKRDANGRIIGLADANTLEWHGNEAIDTQWLTTAIAPFSIEYVFRDDEPSGVSGIYQTSTQFVFVGVNAGNVYGYIGAEQITIYGLLEIGWNRVVMSWDGVDTMSFKLNDGIRQTTLTSLVDSVQSFYLGNAGAWGNIKVGTYGNETPLGYFKVYDTVLTPTEETDTLAVFNSIYNPVGGVFGASNILPSSVVTAVAGVVLATSATLTPSSLLVGVASADKQTSVNLLSNSTISAIAETIGEQLGSAVLTSTSTMVGIPSADKVGSVALTSLSTLVGVGSAVSDVSSVGFLASTSSILATPTVDRFATQNLSSLTTLTSIGSVVSVPVGGRTLAQILLDGSSLSSGTMLELLDNPIGTIGSGATVYIPFSSLEVDFFTTTLEANLDTITLSADLINGAIEGSIYNPQLSAEITTKKLDGDLI